MEPVPFLITASVPACAYRLLPCEYALLQTASGKHVLMWAEAPPFGRPGSVFETGEWEYADWAEQRLPATATERAEFKAVKHPTSGRIGQGVRSGFLQRSLSQEGVRLLK